jgi:hypothetical protein
MNVFEYIGLDSTHRKSDKVTMKVKHYDEVPVSRRPTECIYLGEVKKDGVFCHVVVKSADDAAFFSRTGKEFSCTDYLLERVLSSDLPCGVYMTELCCDECSLEALSGIFNPNRKKLLSDQQHEWCKSSYLAFHDFVPIEDFIRGESILDAYNRHQWLCKHLPSDLMLINRSLVNGDKFIRGFAKACIERGEEGAVFKRCDAHWVAGHKGWRAMKIVRGVDYDLLCIGAEEGTGKYKGKIANLIFRWKDGKEIKAMLGKGWTHEDADWLFKCWSYGESINGTPHSESSPIGKIFQVYALQESSKGVLRLPKVGELRHDKVEADI